MRGMKGLNSKSTQSSNQSEQIRQLMSDGKPRSIPEIGEALPDINPKTICSAVTRLWRNQKFLRASELKHTIWLKELPRNRFKWCRQKLRWYIANNGGEPLAATVSYEVFDKKTGRNIEAKDTLRFKEADDIQTSQKTGTTDKVLKILVKSPEALFAKDFVELGITRRQATSALHSLYLQKRIQRIGWISPYVGQEVSFEDGWLYHVTARQVEERLTKKDVLSTQKQNIYDFILLRTKTYRSFTRAMEIVKRFRIFKRQISDTMKEIEAVYKDLAKEVINGENFYYVQGLLTDEELEAQRQVWKTFGEKRSSFHGVMGRAHESFVQLGMDRMWDKGDLKFADYHWEFSIDKYGRKRYNRFHQRVSNPKRRWEFDRILHCLISPFSKKGNNEVILVFEMKYRGNLDKDLWEKLVYKLADTWTFGYESRMRDIQGNRVTVRLIKHNIIPVIVVPWAGQNSIEARLGKETRKINFAQFVTMQGGVVLFTNEFEAYLNAKLGRRTNFMKMFKAWWTQKQAEKAEDISEDEFTKILLEHLSQKKGSSSEGQPNPTRCTQNSDDTA